jgi:hypothetical protein
MLDQGYFDINSPRRPGPGPLPRPYTGGPTGPTGPSAIDASIGLRGLNGPTGPPATDDNAGFGRPTGPTGPTTLDISAAQTRDPASEVRITLTGVAAAGLAVGSSTTEGHGAFSRPVIARALSAKPDAIRNAARSLVSSIEDQIEFINASASNDEGMLRRQRDFVNFLKSLTEELSKLADSLDTAIAGGSVNKPEPIFLGKAAEIATRLQVTSSNWIEAHLEGLVDFSIRLGLVATGYQFLHLFNVPDASAGIVSAVLAKTMPTTANNGGAENPQK